VAVDAGFLSADRLVALDVCLVFALAAGTDTSLFEDQERSADGVGVAGADHTRRDRTATDEAVHLVVARSRKKFWPEAVITLGTVMKGQELIPHLKADNLPPPAELIDIVVKPIDTVEFAHGDDVMHRNIKPANIAYAPDTGKAFLKSASERVTSGAQMVADLRACASALAS